MKKIKKVWEIAKENPMLLYTTLALAVILIGPSFWSLVVWFVYMTYRFYELLAEFVKNHRTSVGIQIKEYVEKRNLVEDEGEQE